MVSELNYGLSGPGLSPGWGHYTCGLLTKCEAKVAGYWPSSSSSLKKLGQ